MCAWLRWRTHRSQEERRRRDEPAGSGLSRAEDEDEDEQMRCGYTLAAGWKALDPERAVYLISVKSSVWDLVLNQTHEPNAAVLIRDSGLLRREGIVKSLPGRPSRNHRLHSSPPQRLRNANRGRLRLLYVKGHSSGLRRPKS